MEVSTTTNQSFLELYSKIPVTTITVPSPSQENSGANPTSASGELPPDPVVPSCDHTRHKDEIVHKNKLGHNDKLVNYDESLRIVSANR